MNESPIETFTCPWDVLDDICEFFAYLNVGLTDSVDVVLDKDNAVLVVGDPKSGRTMECQYGTPEAHITLPLTEFLILTKGTDAE